jgi:hypothetical protein
LPAISKLVNGCAYNARQPIAAFNLWSMPVVIEAKKLTVYKAANAKEGQAVLDWLKDILKAAAKTGTPEIQGKDQH